MKKTLLIASLAAAFMAAPLAACDMNHEAKSGKDEAAVKTEKTTAKQAKTAKAGKASKDSKTVALANDQKAKN